MADHSEEEDEIAAIVIDNGSGKIKSGFAGDDAPRSVIHNVIGKSKYMEFVYGADDNHYIGDEAQARRSKLGLHYPMTHGVVTNWDDMQEIWQYIFDRELRIPSESQPVIMSDACTNPKTNCEKMTEIMFESFQTPAFYVSNSSLLSQMASGRGIAIVVDSGDGVTTVTPIYELNTFPHAMQRMHLAGRDLTEFMARLLSDRGFSCTEPDEMETVREIKERLCYVAEDYEQELQNTAQTCTRQSGFELPNGQRVTIGEECFKIPEVLFKPWMIGMEGAGIHKMVYDCIQKCDIDLRKDFYVNILLSGGNTMFPGFGQRLEGEIKKLAPPSVRVRVVQPPERKCSVWIGGSILASLSTFQNMWISRAEYDEEGPQIVHKKC